MTFDFRKKAAADFNEPKWIEFEGKRIFDVVVNWGEEE